MATVNSTLQQYNQQLYQQILNGATEAWALKPMLKGVEAKSGDSTLDTEYIRLKTAILQGYAQGTTTGEHIRSRLLFALTASVARAAYSRNMLPPRALSHLASGAEGHGSAYGVFREP